ncbi:PEP-CTERM sorting domain-containing protein [Leptolyngbyaceae cyanobacterium CCMR0081]|uniref:PEP-CTERM sorting domain-containing protein n=1 Tax=Adonisia turfae CCMR0081 TaxID=2292702 RepID=A0A6M0RMQ7_9CYAN|nr:PEP-CTERM sorting domain-containing protein [Adonisia turfae CCMR0081]
MGTPGNRNLLLRGDVSTLNKIIITAGATLSAIGLIAGAPAHASTLSFNFQLDTSADVGVSPFLAGLTWAGVTLPDSFNIDADDVTGSFIVLDDPDQFTDGEIELGYDFIGAALGNSYEATLDSLLGDFELTSEQALQSIDDLFTITQFTGKGILKSESFDVAGNPKNPSPFNITYDNQANSVLINGYSEKVASSCLLADCSLTGNVSYGIGVVLSELVTVTGDLLANSAIEFSEDTSNAIRGLRQAALLVQQINPSLETLSLATVNTTFAANTEFLSFNPNGSADDISFDVTGGTLSARATTDGQEEQLFTRAYATEEEATKEEVTATENWTATKSTSTATLTGVTSSPTTSVSSSTPQLLATVDDSDVQDVPEPSIVLGFLGTAAWMAKRNRRKTVA